MHTTTSPRFAWLAAGLALLLPAFAAAQEKLADGAKVTKLEARPAAVALKNRFDYAQVVVTATLASGEQLDATRLVKWDALPALLNMSPTGLLRPTTDGAGALTATLAGQSVKLPVTVSGTKAEFVVNYIRDVMPVMAKLGCNAGTCHGSADGKNGFKLSLRGYDPVFDYRALTDDLEGRRFNRAAPDRSLMLLKPAGVVPHVGGAVMQPGEAGYELLKLWIAQGVKFDTTVPRVTSLAVQPQGPMIPRPGMKQQMVVVARYTDGNTRDVTAEAFVDSSNTDVATVDKAGLVTSVRRGETTMLARYEGAYAASTVVVMGDRAAFAWQDVPAFNWIDELVYAKHKQIKVQPSGLCTDADFIRRVSLDLTGLPPTPEELRRFLADSRPMAVKRNELIDALIGSDAFVDQWTNKWADLLQVNRKFLGDAGAQKLRDWIKKAVVENRPYDEFVRQVLTASGSTAENPPAAYFKTLRDAPGVMENTTQLFLAVRFNCNKCHDHPFERWTQDQYYQLSSFFAQVGRVEDPKYKGQKIGGSAVEGSVPLVEVVSDTGGGDAKHERTGLPTPPQFPYQANPLDAKQPRRQQLAKWLTARDNQYFAKSYVNRLWAYLLGVGLIEPIDDIRAGNPPTNPALLERLAREFVQSGFDTRHMLRLICQSRTYQLSVETNRWNADDETNYSHAIARRLPAEVIFDAVHRAAGSQPNLPGLPAGGRAAQLLDSNVELPGGFLELFGKPVRESACECERSSGMMLGPVLAMINGPIVGEALKDPNNRLAKLVASEKDDAKVVTGVYEAVLCRLPTAKEVELGVQALRSTRDEFARMAAADKLRKDALAAYEKLVPAKQVAWEKSVGVGPEWKVLELGELKSKGGATFAKLPDGSTLASGTNLGPEVYTIAAKTDLVGVTGFRLELLADKSLPKNGPGRAENGNVVISEFKLSTLLEGSKDKPKAVKFARASASFSQPSWDIVGAIDNKPDTGWAIMAGDGKAQPAAAIFEPNAALGKAGEKQLLTFTVEQNFPDKTHNMGRFRLSATTDKKPALKGNLPDELSAALKVPAEKRTPEQKSMVTNYYRATDKELARLLADAAQVIPADARLLGAQDLAWALMNSPAFLFNH